MPRRKTAVKSIQTQGAVDLHFHGAFGIDLMTASPAQMDELSRRLLDYGIAAFCPTTLSTPRAELEQAVGRIGQWIRSKKHPGALPLGIHLEGPFISSQACGAHPPATIRPLDFKELDSLWKASQETLKILTIAPEILSREELKRLVAWARSRKVILSLGHSRATEEQARDAFELGFRNLTHAWNALPFHQRSPGPLGAALGSKNVFVELIIDQAHVAPALIRWTQKLHSQVCYISDCVPAAATSGGWYSFGPLKIEFKDGACRLEGGHLAGGGLLLTEAFARWVSLESQRTGLPISKTLRTLLPGLTLAPLQSIGMKPGILGRRKAHWKLESANRVSINRN